MKRLLLVILLAMFMSSFSFAASNWFVNTEINNDFRYRWQQETKADQRDTAGDKFTRYRERIRYRLGFTTKANDEMSFSARLATGEKDLKDPLSTNQTMGDATDGRSPFGKMYITLDQAYATYTPAWIPADYGQLKILLGKFDVKEGLYTVTDIMWDTDISLEGKNVNYKYNTLAGVDGLNLFANLGNYIVVEDTQYDDYIINTQQLGVNWNISSIYSTDLAASKYTRNKAGSTDTNAMFLYDKPINESMAKFNVDTQSLGVPYVGKVSLLWDEYINTNESDRNRGTSSGLEIGTPKLAVLGDWSLRGLNRKLEKNVGWTLGDSDTYGGAVGAVTGLNTKGTELELKVALAENAVFGIDQYLIDAIDNDLGNDLGLQRLTQFDFNVKF